VICLFQGHFDAENPMGALIFDHAGNLYGTTYGGGFEAGTIFELSPPAQQDGPWSETILHRFVSSDGGAPTAGLAFDLGALFGTTSAGGKTGQGTVFTLQPPSVQGGDWSLAVLYNLLTPGAAGLTIANPHTLYGITGHNSGTTVFQISNGGGPLTVTTFSLGAGLFPAAKMSIYNGALYGTTAGGGYKGNGIVFKLSH
jgi:uncharacterized repeat protein (TIGR03803 family)